MSGTTAFETSEGLKGSINSSINHLCVLRDMCFHANDNMGSKQVDIEKLNLQVKLVNHCVTFINVKVSANLGSDNIIDVEEIVSNELQLTS